MRPLQIVHPFDLEIGKQYLIEHIGPSDHTHPRCKGIFIGNILPECQYQCIQSKFNNIQDNAIPNIKPHYVYKLQDCFYRYYEADAVAKAYTTHVLRTITGDPDFQFDLPTTTKK